MMIKASVTGSPIFVDVAFHRGIFSFLFFFFDRVKSSLDEIDFSNVYSLINLIIKVNFIRAFFVTKQIRFLYIIG